MSRGATLQRRTTYHISLTLVKLEAVGDEKKADSTEVFRKHDTPSLGSTPGLAHCLSLDRDFPDVWALAGPTPSSGVSDGKEKGITEASALVNITGSGTVVDSKGGLDTNDAPLPVSLKAKQPETCLPAREQCVIPISTKVLVRRSDTVICSSSVLPPDFKSTSTFASGGTSKNQVSTNGTTEKVGFSETFQIDSSLPGTGGTCTSANSTPSPTDKGSTQVPTKTWGITGNIGITAQKQEENGMVASSPSLPAPYVKDSVSSSSTISSTAKEDIKKSETSNNAASEPSDRQTSASNTGESSVQDTKASSASGPPGGMKATRTASAPVPFSQKDFPFGGVRVIRGSLIRRPALDTDVSRDLISSSVTPVHGSKVTEGTSPQVPATESRITRRSLKAIKAPAVCSDSPSHTSCLPITFEKPNKGEELADKPCTVPSSIPRVTAPPISAARTASALFSASRSGGAPVIAAKPSEAKIIAARSAARGVRAQSVVVSSEETTVNKAVLSGTVTEKTKSGDTGTYPGAKPPITTSKTLPSGAPPITAIKAPSISTKPTFSSGDAAPVLTPRTKTSTGIKAPVTGMGTYPGARASVAGAAKSPKATSDRPVTLIEKKTLDIGDLTSPKEKIPEPSLVLSLSPCKDFVTTLPVEAYDLIPDSDDPGKAKRLERLFHRQDAMWISTSVTSDYFLQNSPNRLCNSPRQHSSPTFFSGPRYSFSSPASPLLPVPCQPGTPYREAPVTVSLSVSPDKPGDPLKNTLQVETKTRPPYTSSASISGLPSLVDQGKIPPVLLTPCKEKGSRMLKLTKGSKSQDIRDKNQKGGSNRLSWPENEGGKSRSKSSTKSSPRAETPKPSAGGKSLLSPSSCDPKAFRKGKSKTVDNSDFDLPTDEFKKGRDGASPTGDKSRSSAARDRKMLKFISGIFTKSTAASTSSPTGLSPGDERDFAQKCVINSQEWTLSRSTPEIRVGIVGNIKGGKSALVHRFVTGSYLAIEAPESDQFKKEISVEGQSYLLLIREEAGAPDAKFANWVDGVIFVFSLENEASFQDMFQYYALLANYRSVSDIAVALVGTQDKISSSNPRVIEDVRARGLCNDMKRCMYYETCATYGLNVDRVFSEVAQKILALKRQQQLLSCKSLPSSPSHSGGSTPLSVQTSNGGPGNDYSSSLPSTPNISHRELRSEVSLGVSTPGSLHRGAKRRTSLFPHRRGSDMEKRSFDSRGEVSGTGRALPIKQSFLLKRSGNSLNKEWKKKYVTLTSNGMLLYHPSINDYLHNTHGKEMDLLRTTVKVPGKRPPRAISACGPSASINGLLKDVSSPPVIDPPSTKPPTTKSSSTGDVISSPCIIKEPPPSPMCDKKKNKKKKNMTPSKTEGSAGQADAKRKMWKLKTFGSLRNIYKTEENFEFIIVSSTGQTWHFETGSFEERDSWVQAIESQILASLQCCESSKNKARMDSQSEAVAIQAIRNAKGNNLCVDCNAPSPTWASLNLGALICIECSGIHRNLGTHLSRVRSLDLDDWPLELTLVLTSIGNETANSIWEMTTHGRTKPNPDSSREERESWIRAKYEQRLFLAPLKSPGISLVKQLFKAVQDKNLASVLLLLAHSNKEQINSATGDRERRTALHLSCELPHVVITQLLVWYGVDVKAKDINGHTALFYARRAGSQECVDILLQHGCPNEPSSSMSTPILRRKSSCTSIIRTDSRTALV